MEAGHPPSLEDPRCTCQSASFELQGMMCFSLLFGQRVAGFSVFAAVCAVWPLNQKMSKSNSCSNADSAKLE